MNGLSEEFTLGLLERAMDVSSVRHRVIANNVANVDTPGYKRFSVELSSSLESIFEPDLPLSRTHPMHLSGTDLRYPYPVVKVDNTVGRNDGNNVDVDVEMALLGENSIWYSALARQVDEMLARWRLAISEGRR